MRAPFSPADWVALAVFIVAWLLYEPVLKAVASRGGVINTDMTVIRRAWMANMVVRENRFMDGQLLGQVLNSNSFFASSNLILIAAAVGTLFHGAESYRTATTLIVAKASSRSLFEAQVGLVALTLARGLLAFVWSIRQLNYCLAAFGAAPSEGPGRSPGAYAAAVARLLNPALSAFNAGIRGYYFAGAAAAWLFGPWTFMGATVLAVALLFWRQRLSPAAGAIASLRRVLEAPSVDGGPGASNSRDRIV
jgi:uncharacterized membrane protein